MRIKRYNRTFEINEAKFNHDKCYVDIDKTDRYFLINAEISKSIDDQLLKLGYADLTPFNSLSIASIESNKIIN